MLLQSDLDKLMEWTGTWGMEFNVKKCNIPSCDTEEQEKVAIQVPKEWASNPRQFKTQNTWA